MKLNRIIDQSQWNQIIHVAKMAYQSQRWCSFQLFFLFIGITTQIASKLRKLYFKHIPTYQKLLTPIIINFDQLINQLNILFQFQQKLIKQFSIQENQDIMEDLEDDLDIAIQQLSIKTDGNPNDRQELYRILFDILGYPLIDEALIHERSNLLGQNDLVKTQEEIEKQIKNKEVSVLKVCKCCGILQQNAKLKCNTHLKELNISLGVRLYFMSLAYHAIVFTIGTFIYSVYSAVTNYRYSLNNNFEEEYCYLKGTCNLARIGFGAQATRNSVQNQNSCFIEILLSIGFIVIWGCINMYRVHNQKLLGVQNDEKNSSASDFTLLMEDVPKEYLDSSKGEVIKKFNKIFKQYEKVTKTTLSYKVAKVTIGKPLYQATRQISQKKTDLVTQIQNKQNIFRSWINHRRTHKQFPTSPQHREQFYEQYIKFYIEEYDTKQLNEVELQDKCTVFVTMQSSRAREEIVKLNESSLLNFLDICKKHYYFPMQNVIIKNAPEPQEIMWENIGFLKYKRTIRKLLIYLVALFLISLSLGGSITLGFLQTKIGEAYISILISIVITIINFIIEYIIQSISFLEHEYNKTDEQASIAFKIGLSQLLNSVGVPIAISYISNKSVYESGGMGTDIFFLGLFNILTPIGRFIDPFYLYLNAKEIYYNQPDQRLKMFGQEKLNQHYASYEMELGYQYSYIIRTVIFTSFFMCIQPVIAVFAPIGLGLMYAVNKYKLYYRFCRPKFHNFHVNDIINWMVAIGPACFALGHLYCYFWLKQTKVSSTSIKVALWVSFAFACFMIFFVLKIIYRCVKKPVFPDLDFFDKKAVLMSDYDLLNPVTKDEAICQMEDYFGQLENVCKMPNRWQLLKLKLQESAITSKRVASLRHQILTSRNQSKQNKNPDGSKILHRQIKLKKDQNGKNNITQIPLAEPIFSGGKQQIMEQIIYYDKPSIND